MFSQASSSQVLSNSRAYLRIIYEKTKGQVPLGPSIGKENIQAKEVYSISPLYADTPLNSCLLLMRVWQLCETTREYKQVRSLKIHSLQTETSLKMRANIINYIP